MAQSSNSSPIQKENRTSEPTTALEVDQAEGPNQIEGGKISIQTEQHEGCSVSEKLENDNDEKKSALLSTFSSLSAENNTQGCGEIGATLPQCSVVSISSILENSFLPYPPASGVAIPGEIQWEQLINGSTLVFLNDRNLVPDSLFVSMAQMEPCKLGELDRCGAYKTRELGYVLCFLY